MLSKKPTSQRERKDQEREERSLDVMLGYPGLHVFSLNDTNHYSHEWEGGKTHEADEAQALIRTTLGNRKCKTWILPTAHEINGDSCPDG